MAVQRAPDIRNLLAGDKREDAADWTSDQIDNWMAAYEQLASAFRSDYADEANKVRTLMESQKYKDEKQAKTDPIGYKFDKAKTGIARDQEKIKAAHARIDAYDQGDHSNDVFQPALATVVRDLKAIVDDPAYMDQKQYPICGADTYMRTFATHQPELYVAMVIDLMTTGTGRLGAQVITAPKSVKDKHLFATKMHIAEWVAAASLRVESNLLYGNVIQGSESKLNFPKNWHAGLAGMTSLKEVRDWFLATGVPKTALAMESHVVEATPLTMITKINVAFLAGHAVALMVNQDAVGNKPDKSISPAILFRHLVTLASDIRLVDGNYMADVMTWGAKKRMVCKQSQMSRTFLGYVSADLSSLNGPAQASAGTAHDGDTSAGGDDLT